MSIENNWIFSEKNNEKLKNTEKEKKLEVKKQVEFQKTKEKIDISQKSEDEIFYLKELVEKWLVTKEVAEKIISWENMSNKEIEEIFDKIDEIEDIKNIDNYLPQNLRIKKDDYLKAIQDDIFRVQVLTKIDTALTLISQKINPDWGMWMNLFTWFLSILDKNLILIQENTIDIKDSLKEIDNKKFPKKEDSRSFFRKIIDFIKELIK